MIGKTGNALSPAYYVAFGAVVSLIALNQCGAALGGARTPLPGGPVRVDPQQSRSR